MMRLMGGLLATLLVASVANATPPWEMLNDFRTSEMRVVETTGDSSLREPIRVTLNGPTITLERADTTWQFRLVDYAQSWCGVQEYIAEPFGKKRVHRDPLNDPSPLVVTLYDFSEAECGEGKVPQWELIAEAPVGYFRLAGNPTSGQTSPTLVP